jgi:hypothetical protein
MTVYIIPTYGMRGDNLSRLSDADSIQEGQAAGQPIHGWVQSVWYDHLGGVHAPTTGLSPSFLCFTLKGSNLSLKSSLPRMW